MANPILMPKAGITVESCILTEWKVKVGDKYYSIGNIISVKDETISSATVAGTVSLSMLQLIGLGTDYYYGNSFVFKLPTGKFVIVDGGIPQVKAAKIVFEKLDIKDIYLMGLEKDDRHRTKAIVTSDLVEIEIDKHSNLFLLLEAMQDEVHRFAITFFKETHTKNTFNSMLDEIEGIGKRRKMALLKAFDSLEDMASASVEKLISLGIPKKIAEELLIKLNTKE